MSSFLSTILDTRYSKLFNFEAQSVVVVLSERRIFHQILRDFCGQVVQSKVENPKSARVN